MATVFIASTFAAGGKAPELRKRMVSRRFIPKWQPTSRIWRGTYEQWIQFEPEGWSGPFFWSGKPAILATRPRQVATISSDQALFVGYYVERGTPTNTLPEARIDENWHWHGFYRCLLDPVLRDALDGLMLNLPENRRTVWLDGSATDTGGGKVLPPFDHVLPYLGPATLDQAKALIDTIQPEQWINVMLGNRFPKSECLSRAEEQLVGEFRTPIIRAAEIHDVVQGAMTSRRP
jgi:hypothetical protein